MSKRGSFFTAVIFLALLLSGYAYAEKQILQDERVIVQFDSPLQHAAMEVLRIYPAIRVELKKDLGWATNFRPEVILIKDSAFFRQVSRSDLVTALAVPQKDIILIDYSKMGIHPFTLATTLKHELCHLELHHHIAGGKISRWFDEGICQWVTGGFAELVNEGNRSALKEAVLSHRIPSIESLTESFPADGNSLVLAYEESKNIVEYIRAEFGVSGVRSILEHMSRGDTFEDAVEKSLLISLAALEQRWRASLDEQASWFSYLSANLYEVLFFCAALLSVYGFFRVIRRKRTYKDEEEPEDETM